MMYRIRQYISRYLFRGNGVYCHTKEVKPMLTVDAVEQRFYQKTGVRDDEMVIIPFVNNDGSFGSRIEPANVYYDMLKYVSEH